ncbi:MAG: hypothetical protein FJ030_08670 [Chloroflexi bacterium]|nr:hypothetical protein [Chloroflexota bacterium]
MTPVEIQQYLQSGIEAVKRGQKQRACELLMSVVDADENNEQAWLWLSAVMESLDDQITALENALDINPTNQAAQRGLAALKSRLAAEQPATVGGGAEDEFALPLLAATAPTRPLNPLVASPPPVNDIADYAPLSPVETISALDDPFQCVYCGAPAAPELRRCPQCNRDLMIKVGARTLSSTLRTAVFAFLAALALAAFEAITTTIFYYQGDNFLTEYIFQTLALDTIFGNYLLWPPEWAQAITVIGFGWLAILIILMFGVRYRLVFAYYLSIGAMALNIVWMVYRWLNGFSGPVLGISQIFLSIATLSFVFASERDFEVNTVRLTCAVEPHLKGGEALHKMGHVYKNRNQWALAVAHWRAAIGAIPHRADFYKDLAIGYAQIRYYERSLKALSEFSRLSPGHRDIAPLRSLIEQKRRADRKPRG